MNLYYPGSFLSTLLLRQTDSPVKDMKKKMAANAEKEKNAEQATSKPADKPADKTDKPADKPAEKPADKPADKPKVAEKPADKSKAPEKEKNEKPVEKKDKPAEKKEPEKKKEENGKGESSGKTEKPASNGRPKQNGSSNGNSNGMNGTVSPESDSDSLVVDDDETELFPELAYEDSDVEWEPGMDCPSRSLTRRSQVKVTRTPETPRPASDKQDTDESKDSKAAKPTESGKDTPKDKKSDKSDVKSDAKSDAKSIGKSDAKPEAKPTGKSDAKSDAKSTGKTDAKSDAKKSDTPKKDAQDAKVDAKKDVKESPKKGEKKEEISEKVVVQVVVEIENNGESDESRKPDTNFSKSRVKVSPYRRSMRLADQTTSSIAANYTGNNTTMEMDITESSFMDDTMDDSYLSGLRSIKGRRSYKLLKDLPPRTAQANSSARSVTSITVSEQSYRPTAPVVGRKRKPEPEDNISVASEAEESPVAGKRQRLLDRLARPFRRSVLMPTRRNAEIVGINTDLPLTAPVASTSSFDPETLKTGIDVVPPPPPVVTAPVAEDAKRCVVM